MAFCINCGQELAEGAKFCAGCGTAVPASQRKTIFDGEIHECPNCGEVLESFVAVCPSCGCEIRGTSTTSAVREFVAKIDAATTGHQKESIIRNFPIPNTKEDIFEFMILAFSNIAECPNKNVFKAWITKFEQCYQKAKLSFGQDDDFAKIQAIYEKAQKEIRKIRYKGPLRKLLIILLPIVAFFLINIAFWSWVASGYNNEEEEIARLESIVSTVESAIENGEYDLAMMHAKSIDYSAWTANDELERQWDIKRDYLIKKIIAAASEKGIIMEYPSDTADEMDQDNTKSHYDYDESKEQIQDNINEFNDNINMWK